MRTSRKITVVAAVLALGGLTACSDESTSPSGGTSSSSASPTAASKDRSEEVFSAYTPTKVIGSTSGTVNLGVGGGNPDVGGEKVTFEVTGVTATAESTILHYQLVADMKVDFRIRGEFWSQQPSLRVPGADSSMQSVTAALPGADGKDDLEVCACTAIYSAAEEPRPQSVVYPPLPKDVSEVEVILQALDPVTVPVTR